MDDSRDWSVARWGSRAGVRRERGCGREEEADGEGEDGVEEEDGRGRGVGGGRSDMVGPGGSEETRGRWPTTAV